MRRLAVAGRFDKREGWRRVRSPVRATRARARLGRSETVPAATGGTGFAQRALGTIGRRGPRAETGRGGDGEAVASTGFEKQRCSGHMSRKMNHGGPKHAAGVITLVQENRFKLADDEGRSELFVLAHDAPLEAQDLQFLQRSQSHVTVVYTDADDLIAGVAHDVLPADRR